jgi:hypothetical protein
MFEWKTTVALANNSRAVIESDIALFRNAKTGPLRENATCQCFLRISDA